MRAGGLRHLITIESVSESGDGMGGEDETWSEHTKVWADIKPLKGDEALEHRKLQHEHMHRIWIRYQSGLTTKMRIAWGTRTLQIIGMRNVDERDKMIEILADELVT